jgi:hypothetical protein
MPPKTKNSADDTSVPMDQVSERVGCPIEKLIRWLEDHEWMVRGDTSCDVVPEQIENGNIILKNGVPRITTQGIAVLKKALGGRATAVQRQETANPPALAAVSGNEIPF